MARRGGKRGGEERKGNKDRRHGWKKGEERRERDKEMKQGEEVG